MKKILPLLVVGILVLSGFGATALTNIENNPPDAPEIAGPIFCKVGVSYCFTFTTVDPDGDNVSYYIEWGDGTSTGWTLYFCSGEPVLVAHTWDEIDWYNIIRCKAKDIHGAEGNWSITQIPIMKNKDINLQSSSILNSQSEMSVIPSTGNIVSFDDDTTPPVTTCTLDPPEPDGDNGWYVNDVNVTLNATDDVSGVKAIYYKIPGGEWKNHTGDFLIFILDYDCLIGRIEFYSVDYAGNQEETKSVRIDMDQLPPDIGDPVWEAFKECGKWYVTFPANATDACSGTDRVEMFINDGFHEEIVGAGPTYEFTIEWSAVFKSATFWFYCYDVAGNVAIVQVNGSDIKSYSRSQSSSQQPSFIPSSQSEMSVIPSTGKIDVATSRTTFNDGSLSGYVNDTSMNPIEGALVRVYFHGTYEENYTDSSGYYNVTNIPICYCMKNCTASKDGYKTEWVLLGIDENTTYDFVLYTLEPCYPVLNGTMGWNGWWISPVTVSFVFDPEEVAEIWYDYKGWHLYTEPFVVDENGTIIIDFYWINYEGEQSPHASIIFDMDQIPPQTDLEYETYMEDWIWYVKFIFSAVDDISGMHEVVEMYINDAIHEIVTGPGPVYEFVIAWNIMHDWVFKFVCHDNAGNEAFESMNGSDIKSHSSSQSRSTQQSQNMWFMRWLERFPILQKILDVLRLNIR